MIKVFGRSGGVTIILMADSKKELDSITETVETIGKETILYKFYNTNLHEKIEMQKAGELGEADDKKTADFVKIVDK